MASQGGISGTAVASVTAGSLLLYAALTGRTPLAALKDVLSGHPTAVPAAAPYVPQGSTTTVGTPVTTAGGGPAGATSSTAATPAGAAIVSVARAQIGKPYGWGKDGPDSFDCSGLVSYCLRQAGVVPAGFRYVTTQFLLWSGATTIARPPRAGDLICWTGHIAIATSATTMIAAPGIGQKVKEQNIYWTGSPLVRRLKAV